MRKSQKNTDENNLLFAFWLCAQGIVDPQTAYNAYQYRQTHKPDLEELTLFNGLLTVQQSIEIQSLQSVVHLPFGEAAVKLGFLTKAELSALQIVQINSAPTLIEAIRHVSNDDRKHLQKAQEIFLKTELTSWSIA